VEERGESGWSRSWQDHAIDGVQPSLSLIFSLLPKARAGVWFRRGVVDQIGREKRGWSGLGFLDATHIHTHVYAHNAHEWNIDTREGQVGMVMVQNFNLKV
jgi:hypothetical protein